MGGTSRRAASGKVTFEPSREVQGFRESQLRGKLKSKYLDLGWGTESKLQGIVEVYKISQGCVLLSSLKYVS